MKETTPYIRIRRSQATAAERRLAFKIREALLRRIALALQEQDNASNLPRPT